MSSDHRSVSRAVPNAHPNVAPTPRAGLWRRRGVSIVPIVGDLLAMIRLLRDRGSARWAKLLVIASIAYVVFPLDALPDLAPFVGWLDDAGLILALRVLMHRQLNPYRYPLGGAPPAAGPPQLDSELGQAPTAREVIGTRPRSA